MAMRDFHPQTRSSDRRDKRGDAVRIVGGALAMRRAHGQPTGATGVHVYDPIFNEAHIALLRDFCAADEARPLVVEVGFQRARFARAYCSQHPEVRYMGFEIRRKFVEESDAWMQRGGCENYRLSLVDAREAMPELLEPGTVDRMFTFFPDPWWKSKQRKRRLLDRSFVALAASLLKPGGTLLVKTDVAGYADWAQAELEAVTGLRVERLADPRAGLPPTQRERRCIDAGLPTWAVEATRLVDVEITISDAPNRFDLAHGYDASALADDADSADSAVDATAANPDSGDDI